MFGGGFWANSVFLFTRWDMKDSEEMLREMGVTKTTDQFYEEFKTVIDGAFAVKISRDQLIFIDNLCVNPKLVAAKMYSQEAIDRFNT